MSLQQTNGARHGQIHAQLTGRSSWARSCGCRRAERPTFPLTSERVLRGRSCLNGAAHEVRAAWIAAVSPTGLPCELQLLVALSWTRCNASS